MNSVSSPMALCARNCSHNCTSAAVWLIISDMIAQLLALLRLYGYIAIWQRGPQDLPAVGILLPLTIGAYVLVSAVVGALLPGLHPGWLLQVAGDALFVAAWYWLLLVIARRRE